MNEVMRDQSSKNGRLMTKSMDSILGGPGDRGGNVNIATTVSGDTGGDGVVPNRPGQVDSGQVVQENVEFVDETVGDIMRSDALSDSSYLSSMVPGADLARFLNRPVPIQEFSWEIGADPTFDFRPWYDYFNDTFVKKKLDNYAFISCRMHVKFVINASPFLYGAAIVAYQPVYNLYPHTLSGEDEPDKIRLSQRPHIWLKPQNSSGGELTLPFFYYKDWLRITEADDMTNMGRIEVREFVPLASANDGTTNTVSVTVYAWAEDVKLAGPTVGLSMQAKDEYGDGIVSFPASAVATAAGFFEKIPIIGKFATATRIGATAISGIASLFGWSNPPIVSDVMPYKSLPFHSVGTASISEPIDKLTLDPKNEVTVDPSVAGLTNADEMTIGYIVQRESYICTTTWENTDASNFKLFQSAVTPLLEYQEDLTDEILVGMTPMSHLARMFKCWRGDIIFRFQVICTQYHKGRLAIVWDPASDLSAAANYTNVTYTKIIDIGSDNDVEFRVPYMQAKPWLETEWANAPPGTNLWITSGSATDYSDSNKRNGNLHLRVLTKLTAPVDTASVDILVSVRGAPNLEFANPISISPHWSNAPIPEEAEPMEGMELQAQTAQGPTLMTLDEAGTSDPNRYLINFGENINSIRTLLRRSSRAFMMEFSSQYGGADWIYMAKCIRQMPPACGYDTNGLHEDTASNAVNYCAYHPINWMQMCYMGRRGSTRLHLIADHFGGPIGNLSIVRTDTRTSKVGTTVMKFSATMDDDIINYQLQAGHDYYAGGAAVTHQLTQAGLSVELPLYNVNRFVSSDPLLNNVGSTVDGTSSNTFHIQHQHYHQTDNIGSADLLYSIGTDFNFLFYLDAPTMFFRDTVVGPV